METVRELVNTSESLLSNNSITTANFLRPHYPTCVFYFGERSALYHKELLSDITRGWGGNAEHIKFYTIEDADKEGFTSTVTGEALSIEDMNADIKKLLSAQSVFSDMSRIAMYCIFDTQKIDDPDVFSKWYRKIEYIEGIFKGASTLTMLMVILDDDLNDKSKIHTNRLLELYKSADVGNKDSHIYDSVFIFGARLKNGGFKEINPENIEYENFNLLADVVLLSNTKDNDYTDRRTHLYGRTKPAITAAYGHVQKPADGIVMVSLKALLNKLKKLIASEFVNETSLMKALKINNGKSEIYESVYSDIKELLPGNDFINWLPGRSEPKGTFDELNSATFGCLQLFVEQNHVSTARAELVNRNDFILREYSDLIASSLNAALIVDGVPNELRKTTYDKAEMALTATSTHSVSDAIELKVKKEIASALRDIADKAINKAVKKAGVCIECFKQLSEELDMMASVGEDGTRQNLTSFYGDKVDRYYSDINKLKDLFDRILNIKNDKADMLRILYDELRLLFESDPDYSLSFIDELIARLGVVDNEKRAQEFIGQELIKDLEDNVRYYSKKTIRTRAFEAYMLNTEGSKNLMYVYLSERPVPPEVTRTFFNTCNNDMAESMWFYYCSEDNLMV